MSFLRPSSSSSSVSRQYLVFFMMILLLFPLGGQEAVLFLPASKQSGKYHNLILSIMLMLLSTLQKL